MNLHTAYIESPIGVLKITGMAEGIRAVEFTDERAAPSSPVPACLQQCVQQLREYFAGSRREFSLRLNPEGTPFQQRVWRELQRIPFGQTTTYLDIAKAIGNPGAIRAVGAANGRNRIPIIIPCHRVIGSDGSLTGFGGGIWRKEFLLRHEGALVL
ncbi:MAG: methylated-DNA--[protein]-cysteine S-methyltransferase [Calditrichaeota bacterium]|nr:MAG: methylated-DNA--[protein]-cysteine S-methyltransferase [Calditrichota bacterium]